LYFSPNLQKAAASLHDVWCNFLTGMSCYSAKCSTRS
jgi:hypothetical protein